MAISVSALAGRVARLADSVSRSPLSGCSGSHTRVRVSHVHGHDAPRPFPAPGSPTHCGCGQPIHYRHIVHQHEAVSYAGAGR